MISLTVKEIKKELDKLGIKYDNKAKKDELLKLLKENKNEEDKREQIKKYVVVYPKWKDLDDNGYIYKKGDVYPRKGYKPTKERIKQLTTKKNKIGEILIKVAE